MGDPKKTKKHYASPRKPWDKSRLDNERVLKETYGLANKRELWRVETTLRKKRINARKLLALPLEERKKRQEELLKSLEKVGLLSENATLDDVLALNIESILERRLQTLVWRRGFADTTKQARQFITHGHIGISGIKAKTPARLITRDEEHKIAYFGKEMQLQEKEKPKKTEKPAEEKKKLFAQVLDEAENAIETIEGKVAEDVKEAVGEIAG